MWSLIIVQTHYIGMQKICIWSHLYKVILEISYMCFCLLDFVHNLVALISLYIKGLRRTELGIE